MAEERKTGEEELDLEQGTDGESDQETPFWLQDEEEPDSSDDGDDDGGDEDDDRDDESPSGENVPVKTHVKVKQKLKGKLKNAESELEKLRRENEELKSGGKKPTQDPVEPASKPPKRPRRSEFDDDEAYETAMDTYEEQRRKYDAQVINQTSQQRQQAQKRMQQLEQSADAHYERAEKVVEKYGIKPEVYQHADKTVKEIIHSVIPQLDPETVFNSFVDMMGEGSEVAMYHIGKNKTAGAEFQRLLQEDPSGLKASLYLGRVAERVGNTKGKRNSQAPAPAAKVKGDQSSNLKEGTAKHKWAEAHKKGRTQEAYNLKKSAKAQGIDVSSWK